MLHAAFLPFGEIKDVSLPVDHGTQKNRGFGFVTFQEPCAPAALTLISRRRTEDAPLPLHAVTTAPPRWTTCTTRSCTEGCAPKRQRRRGSAGADVRCMSQVLRCNYAQPQKIKGGETGWSTQPVWADADAFQELSERGAGATAE